MSAFIVGLLSIALEMAFAYNTGTCLNPTRDLGPRLVTWCAGFGTSVFTLHHYWFIWGSWVSPILGGLFGAVVYDSLIFVGGESPINYPHSAAARDDELRTVIGSKEAGLV
jgi:aquaglyceroporin related protein, other eukaryote